MLLTTGGSMFVLTPIIATAALALSLFNTWHKWRDDQSSKWWDRTVWAMSELESENSTLRESAWDILNFLVRNPPQRRSNEVRVLLAGINQRLD